MEIQFLYWNTNNKPPSFISEIKKIAANIDVLLLVENTEIADSLIEQELGLYKIKYKTNFDETQYTPKFYSRFQNDELECIGVATSKRLVFTSLKLQNSDELLIGGIHFPSKLNYDDLSQSEIARGYVQEIEEVETIRNNTKTLIFGDFNMNPFEPGMIELSAFNATLSEVEAKKICKQFHYKKYNYFYNPMWSFMGDRNYLSGERKQPGSYYYSKSPYWNVYDKVIMRPKVIDIFDFSSIKIIDSLGSEKLVDGDFTIKKDSYSDHLPLSFKIKL